MYKFEYKNSWIKNERIKEILDKSEQCLNYTEKYIGENSNFIYSYIFLEMSLIVELFIEELKKINDGNKYKKKELIKKYYEKTNKKEINKKYVKLFEELIMIRNDIVHPTVIEGKLFFKDNFEYDYKRYSITGINKSFSQINLSDINLLCLFLTTLFNYIFLNIDDLDELKNKKINVFDNYNFKPIAVDEYNCNYFYDLRWIDIFFDNYKIIFNAYKTFCKTTESKIFQNLSSKALILNSFRLIETMFNILLFEKKSSSKKLRGNTKEKIDFLKKSKIPKYYLEIFKAIKKIRNDYLHFKSDNLKEHYKINKVCLNKNYNEWRIEDGEKIFELSCEFINYFLKVNLNLDKFVISKLLMDNFKLTRNKQKIKKGIEFFLDDNENQKISKIRNIMDNILNIDYKIDNISNF